MASKLFWTITVFVSVAALAAALPLDDETDDEGFEMVLNLLEKRTNELDFQADDDLLNETEDVEKRGRGQGRGQGRGRFVRCIHRVSGHSCICDLRKNRNNPRFYRVCGGQNLNQI
ncbi:uncharacterized protein LOC121420771 [Lytechinus variegatus]|uniref:uncharacterized protein LOC121420771 n=1 Tax=Lytechinus variegatus TaxID=7654 RepID=UPI001BB147F1|nr:uncharacterized protein LOC121420771 [Lytechinus variegatus]